MYAKHIVTIHCARIELIMVEIKVSLAEKSSTVSLTPHHCPPFHDQKAG